MGRPSFAFICEATQGRVKKPSASPSPVTTLALNPFILPSPAPRFVCKKYRSPRTGRATYRLATIGLGVLILFAVACATSSEKKGFGTEKLLVAAGFQYKMAQNPEQLEKLRKVPQDKLIRHDHDGKPVYVYVSAEGCKCHYVGDEAAYLKYHELRRDAVLNARLHKDSGPGANIFSTGQDWASDIDDLASGMIPGY